MTAGDIVTLVAIGIVGFAIWLGRRNGKRKAAAKLESLAAALSTARAEGAANVRAELASAAVAHGGQVVLALPGWDGPRGDSGAAGYGASELRHLGAVRGERWPDRDRMGGVLDGVQQRPDALPPVDRTGARDRPPVRDLRVDRDPLTEPYAVSLPVEWGSRADPG